MTNEEIYQEYKRILLACQGFYVCNEVCKVNALYLAHPVKFYANNSEKYQLIDELTDRFIQEKNYVQYKYIEDSFTLIYGNIRELRKFFDEHGTKTLFVLIHNDYMWIQKDTFVLLKLVL